MNEKFFNELKNKVKEFMEVGGSHEFSHTERVYNVAIKISKSENADLDIIKAAVLLHDIARVKEDSGEIKCHAEEGAKMAREILEKTNFPKEKIYEVCECIRVHRYSKGIKAETKEAEILQDADRLDALGAIAIARVISGSKSINRPIYNPELKLNDKRSNRNTSALHHFYHKQLKLKPKTFKTKTARKIAKLRYNFIKEYVDRFIKEWEGKL